MRIFLTLFILLFSTFEAVEYKLSIAAITQNEDLYLKEWIDYHLKMGVEHFYIYDNNEDNDRTAKVLEPYVKEGTVELIPWPNLWKDKAFHFDCQTNAYNDALARARHHTEWLAIIDTDEFFVPLKENTLIDAIRNHYSGHGFIYVNWLMFGTSYKTLTSNHSMLEELTRCASKGHAMNKYGKTICRPELTMFVEGPHFVRTIYPYLNGSGTFRVNDNYEGDILRINHYVFRDEKFLSDVKVRRWSKSQKDYRQTEYVYRVWNAEYNIEDDFRMLELLGK